MSPLRDFAAGSVTGRVLEIGAGTGLNLLHYDWTLIQSLAMTEPDPFMRRRAQERIAGIPLDVRSRVTIDDFAAETLAFAGETFDAVVSTLVLCSVSDLEQALREIYRVLKPDGQLRLVEHVRADGLAGKVQRLCQPVYGWLAADCQLSRATEVAIVETGFQLEVVQRFSLGGPLFPGLAAVATKP
jgi:SAM-dependent methyltransferase